MATPFVGEIRMVGFSFAPVNWALCAGQSVQISQNPTLFQLIGTTYGGDGVNTYNLPDLRSRLVVGTGQGNGLSNYVLGQVGGVESVALTIAQFPQHNHLVACSNAAGNSGVPTDSFPALDANTEMYSTAQNNNTMNGNSIGFAGGNQPHTNIQPYQAINFIISLFGVFPTQN